MDLDAYKQMQKASIDNLMCQQSTIREEIDDYERRMQDLRDLRMQMYTNKMQQNRELNVNVKVVIKHKKEKRPPKEPTTYVPEKRVHLKRIAESPPPAYNFYQRLRPHFTDRQLKLDQLE